MSTGLLDPVDAEREAIVKFLRMLAESENPEQREFFLFVGQLIMEGAHHAGDPADR